LKILVTGATGFLGTSLCAKLEKDGHSLEKVNSKACDLTKQGALESVFKKRKGDFDMVVHLAAWTQAGDFCLYHSGEQWVINQRINTNVLDYWSKEQPQAKIITMGTSCSYDPKYELKEENYMKGVPIESLFTYGMTKRMMYAGLIALNKQYGLKYLQFVPSTLYGPHYHTDGRQMHFIFDLIRKIIRGKRFNEPVVLWGDGHQKRELVYVNDFANIMAELSKKCENDNINIGEGKEHSIRQFAQMICDKVGYDFDKIKFDTTKYVGARSKCLNVEKMRKLTKYRMTPLKEGLDRTIEWFEEHGKV
jgi:GDP-L-fucose synthase